MALECTDEVLKALVNTPQAKIGARMTIVKFARKTFKP